MTYNATRLRVGVVGLGFGASVHAPVLKSFPDVEVVGIAGRSLHKACHTASLLSIPHGFGSISDLLNLGLDAITLALPPDQVASAVNQSLSRRVHILCEKPLGTDYLVSSSLAHASQGLTCAVNFFFAELKPFIYLKHLVDSGSLGLVRHINVLWLTESWVQRSHQWSWKSDADVNGGVLSLFGSHLLYLSEWLLGPVVSLSSQMSTSSGISFAPPGSRPAEDHVYFRLNYGNGVFFSSTIGNANPGLSVHRWHVVFDGGTAILENNSSDYAKFSFTLQRPGLPPEYWPPVDQDGDGRFPAFRSLARRFINSARHHQFMTPDFHAGARVQQLDSAIRASSLSRREICLE